MYNEGISMTPTFRIARVNQLPTVRSRNTLYLVDTPDPEVFDIHLTSVNGNTIERSFSSSDAVALITSLKNTPNGVAGLDSNGLIPVDILPGSIDEIIISNNYASLPNFGLIGKIYVTADTNLAYRWTGSAYIEISSLKGNADTATKLLTSRTINGVPFDGTQGIVINAVDATPRIAVSQKGAPDGVATLNEEGLLQVEQLPVEVQDVFIFDNLAQMPEQGIFSKIYVAADTFKLYAWIGESYAEVATNAVKTVAGKSGIVLLVKDDVGLPNVDNTSDLDKPVSTLQQAAIITAENSAKAASAPLSHVGSSGSAHALATTTTDGFFSAVEKVKLAAITGTNTGDETGPGIRAKLGITTLSGVNTGDQTNITGNAGTATKLLNARNINGVPFDGSANITITAVDTEGRALMAASMGTPNGYATLDSTGKVPSSQLPAFVDDVIEFSSLSAFPTNGATGKMYVALDTNKVYRWSGSAFIHITSGAVDTVAGKTGVVVLDKTDVGLSNVDNTSDVNKPVSSAQQNAILTAENNAKAASTPISHVGTAGAAHALATTTVNGFFAATDKVKLDAITGTNTGDETGPGIRVKLGISVLSGVNTGDQTSVTGNAGTATKLETARTINGIPFDGSANITINAADTVARIAASEKGANNGVATLDATGKVPSGQLPSFVDDVQEFANLAAFPVTGETGKMYVALDTNKVYRWSGSVYIFITSGAVDSVNGKTGVVVINKADVGLGNVDNTSDANKPISSATQIALDLKLPYSQLGAPNGAASLDASGKLLYNQLPLKTLFAFIGAFNGTATIPGDNTTPISTEGTQIASATLGPSDATGRLHISGTLMVDCGTSNRNMVISCFRGNVCIGSIYHNFVTAGRPQTIPLDFFDPDFGSLFGSTATYSIRFGTTAAATWYVNRMASQVLNGMMNLNRPLRFEEVNQ